ncbi:hypothetical protein B0H17DRAFT_1073004 [Mycena rosella]|uniref:Uncharacterized protein n=1 Tax=Mycena rosella TaxID=1033263 RepID=A0AAD7D913_MYCRO|nr:hypothetical protein B0H17DRAFT_1073004 [Mycena rosella]
MKQAIAATPQKTCIRITRKNTVCPTPSARKTDRKNGTRTHRVPDTPSRSLHPPPPQAIRSTIQRKTPSDIFSPSLSC